MTATVQAIFFDLGETLLEFRQADVQSVFKAGAKLAYEYLQQLGKDLPAFEEYRRRQYRAIRWAYLKSWSTRREFDCVDLLKKQSRRMGHEISDVEGLELAELYYRPLREHAVSEPGLIDMLRQFRDAGLTLGVISNTFIPHQILDSHLDAENLLELLPIRIYSCQVRYRKPSRKIFQAAMGRAETQPANAVFVGDSPVEDIRGANRAGLISVLKDVAGRHGRGRARPKHRIRKLAELPEIIAHYNGR